MTVATADQAALTLKGAAKMDQRYTDSLADVLEAYRGEAKPQLKGLVTFSAACTIDCVVGSSAQPNTTTSSFRQQNTARATTTDAAVEPKSPPLTPSIELARAKIASPEKDQGPDEVDQLSNAKHLRSNLKIKKWDVLQTNRLFFMSVYNANRHLISIAFADQNRNIQDVFSKIQKHLKTLLQIQKLAHLALRQRGQDEGTSPRSHSHELAETAADATVEGLDNVKLLKGEKLLMKYIEYSQHFCTYLMHGIQQDPIFKKDDKHYQRITADISAFGSKE